MNGSPGRRRPPVLTIAVTIGALSGLVATAAAPVAAAQPVPAAATVPVEAAVTSELSDRGVTDFWVVFDDRAELGDAAEIDNWAGRGRHVHQRLTATARASQDKATAGLAAVQRSRSGVKLERFWIANTMLVRGGDQATLDAVRELPGVARIHADEPIELPDPIKADADDTDEAGTQAVEWGIADARADRVWGEFDVRGDGIVVGSIDTGVEYTHPALVEQYRGNTGDGFEHDYNWWDPSQVCGSPSPEPCDNNNHGTHTVGTMVGHDGGDNQIGMAPAARWIAAKGCESNQCSVAALLSSAQFMLAPTDLAGEHPRPDLRPHIVNNSWGGGYGTSDPWFNQVIDSWVAAGMFPVVANGNGGNQCQTTGSPAHYEGAWGVGAYNSGGNIASFSSRGPGGSDFESTKPNIAAPGVAVRSSVRNGGYASAQGTSMAAPHVAGAVALLWSAAPALSRDIDQTRRILGDTAVDTEDLTCGGTPENNNVWGEGKLDAHAAVELAPRGATGALTGTVTGAASGDPVAGATVAVQVGERTRTASTGDDGSYRLALSTGSYRVSVDAFGYRTGTAEGVAVGESGATEDFAMAAAQRGRVAGRVLDDQGDPVAGAIVTVTGTPIPPATTDTGGGYTIDGVPVGEYSVSATGCLEARTEPLTVDGDETLDFDLAARTDSFGYSCRAVEPDWVQAGAELSFADPGSGTAPVDLPFPFPFYGTAYTSAQVSVDGFVGFREEAGATFANVPAPTRTPPNVAIYAFWDDLVVDSAASVRTETLGQAPQRQFVVEWRNVGLAADPTKRINAEAVLSEDGTVVTQYRDLGDGRLARGGSATVGVEGPSGSAGTGYSFNQPVLSGGTAIRFGTPAWATVTGRVTDGNDGRAVAGATLRAVRDGSAVRTAVTGADGRYHLAQVPPGTYSVEATADNYETRTTTVTLGDGATEDFVLPTGRAELSPEQLEITVAAGRSVASTVEISNTGGAELAWRFHRGSVERASVAFDGAEGDGQVGFYHDISADGRYVAFDSLATNLVPGGTNGPIHVYVRDRLTGTTERVSVASDGTPGNHSSERPVISDNGRYVAFVSVASNLVPGDTNEVDDVFVHDRETGRTERVSVTSDGTQGNGGGFEVSISGNGRYVAFGDTSTNLVPGDTNGMMDIYVHDRETGTTERVSVASDGAQGNGSCDLPRISADGRSVSFTSAASNLVPGDTNGQYDAFVHDRETGETELVSVAMDGAAGNAQSYPYSISADGRYIGFDSNASNLVPGGTNGWRNSFVRDRETGTTERVSVASDGTQSNQASFTPQVSADGRQVVFFSLASNLVAGDTNNARDVFVRDRSTGITERVSVTSTGRQSNGTAVSAGMSPDARYIAFYSDASDLVPGITNGVQDVFVHERVPWLAPSPLSGTLAPGESVSVEVTVDAADLEPGSYPVGAALVSTSGREPTRPVAVRVVVIEPACAEPDERPTVIIGDVDSGVPNRMTADGCTINDLIRDDQPWPDRGAFVRHVREVTDQLVDDDVISVRERSTILRAAAHSDVGG